MFFARQGHLNGLMITPEDVFYQSARLLDFLFVNPDITQRQVDSLWHKLLIDIRKWKADASEHDKRMVAGTVFQIVRAALAQHTESCYCEYICDLLNQTTWRELEECDKNEQTDFNRRLIEQSPILCEWINQYDDSDLWLSDQIAEAIASSKDNNGENRLKSKNKSQKASKLEKQHGVEYPVFSKGMGVTDEHIIALYRFLTTRGWISTQSSVVDFQRLFSGESNDCEIIWMGMDKQGNNEPTILGISALYVLFKRMADEQLISLGGKSSRIGPILESHFVDTEGRFLTDVSNIRKTSFMAEDYIEKILRMMKTRMSSDDIQSFLEEEMESKYDKNDLQDLRYHNPH